LNAPAPTDEELVAASRDGDTGSFGELMQRHQDRVFNTVYRMVGVHEDACDLTQEAFLNAWRGLRRFRGGAKFSTWMYRIALNAAYTGLRRRAARPPMARLETTGGDARGLRRPAPDSRNDPVEAAEMREEAQLIRRTLMELREEERAIIVLRDIEERNYEEIAEILECPRGTVKSRLHRARETLRRRLARKTDPERSRA